VAPGRASLRFCKCALEDEKSMAFLSQPTPKQLPPLRSG
jgi:hypothetical protein